MLSREAYVLHIQLQGHIPVPLVFLEMEADVEWYAFFDEMKMIALLEGDC